MDLQVDGRRSDRPSGRPAGSVAQLAGRHAPPVHRGRRGPAAGARMHLRTGRPPARAPGGDGRVHRLGERPAHRVLRLRRVRADRHRPAPRRGRRARPGGGGGRAGAVGAERVPGAAAGGDLRRAAVPAAHRSGRGRGVAAPARVAGEPAERRRDRPCGAACAAAGPHRQPRPRARPARRTPRRRRPPAHALGRDGAGRGRCPPAARRGRRGPWRHPGPGSRGGRAGERPRAGRAARATRDRAGRPVRRPQRHTEDRAAGPVLARGRSASADAIGCHVAIAARPRGRGGRGGRHRWHSAGDQPRSAPGVDASAGAAAGRSGLARSGHRGGPRGVRRAHRARRAVRAPRHRAGAAAALDRPPWRGAGRRAARPGGPAGVLPGLVGALGSGRGGPRRARERDAPLPGAR